MNKAINVIVKEDDSIEKQLNKTAKQLHRKYSKKRQINEKLLKPKTPAKRAWSIVFDCLCTVFVILAGVMCFSSINSRIQKVCPTFFGYSNLKVASGSMTNSGLNIGDTVVVQAVDTSTVKEGDIISFYAYSADYNKFDINTVSKVDNQTIGETKYIHSFVSMFGYQPKEIVSAAQAGDRIHRRYRRHRRADEVRYEGKKTFGACAPDRGGADHLRRRITDSLSFSDPGHKTGLCEHHNRIRGVSLPRA